MRYLVYGILYLIILIAMGIYVGFTVEVKTSKANPSEDKRIFVENCMKEGKTQELCTDNFYGFPRQNNQD